MVKMNIGIHHVDGNLPNMALMRIASYHKKLGHDVNWWNGPLFPYDKVYASKIFKFSYDNLPEYVIRGGTGYDNDNQMPEEMRQSGIEDAWFLYPKYKNHFGFSERGCRLKCSFCVVPEKEGQPKKVAEISELLSNPQGEDRLVLLDDDFLGHPDNHDVFQELIDRKLKVCFSQGLNIRIITEKQAELLSKVNFRNITFKSKQVSFAWDNHKDKRLILRGIQRCKDAGIKTHQMQFFVLIGYDSTPEEDLERVMLLKEMGADPFALAYDRDVYYQRRFQRWVNHRAIFQSVGWEDYSG
jgi:radical SAM superfamily enzyme YgiQ (UPF0313 family)